MQPKAGPAPRPPPRIQRLPARPGPPAPGAPTDEALALLLGRSHRAWDQLLTALERAHAPLRRDWHFTAKAAAWHLRLKHGDRTILALLPRDKYFLTALVLGERAVLEILSGNFPDSVTTAVHEARPAAEGRGLRLLTRNRRDVAVMLKLAAIKLAN
jgi:hypothetical protein